MYEVVKLSIYSLHSKQLIPRRDLVLKYWTVRCNRSLDIHSKGDCFDVTGNQCPLPSDVLKKDNSLKCFSKAAHCKIVSKVHCTQNDSCKYISDQLYSPYISSMTLNCTENKHVSVVGVQLFVYSGSQIDIRPKSMYSPCEHKSCSFSFCCNQFEQTQKYMHNLSSDDLLLLKWNQVCKHKQKWIVQVPWWDMLTEPDKNNVIQDYKNDCPSSYPYNL